MSDVQSRPQGKQVDPNRLIMKLRNRIADLEIQIAMLETYIDDLESDREGETQDVGNE